MADQFRDSCVDRQNKNRKSFDGNPIDKIRVSFYDKDGTRVNDVTRSEANCIAGIKTDQLFYYQDGNGYQRELYIDQVNRLSILDALPDAPGCPTNPQLCGPPRVQFYGGMGMGAMANAIVSPNSNSIIGFDIVNPGFNYLSRPFANIVDECGYGSGSTLLVQTQPYGTSNAVRNVVGVSTGSIVSSSDITGNKGGLEIKNIVVTSPGDGYLSYPNGSLGGNGRIWKDVDSGYVQREDGSYYVIPDGLEPPNLPPEDTFFPPTLVQDPFLDPTNDPLVPTYPVILVIDEVYVLDPGFLYEPGDTLEVVSDDGTTKGSLLEPVIDNRGGITRVNVLNPGIGFIDLPEIVINSPRGYNAKLIPVLKAIAIEDIPDPTVIPSGTQLISVVDCVGKIPPKTTFDIVPR